MTPQSGLDAALVLEGGGPPEPPLLVIEAERSTLSLLPAALSITNGDSADTIVLDDVVGASATAKELTVVSCPATTSGRRQGSARSSG